MIRELRDTKIICIKEKNLFELPRNKQRKILSNFGDQITRSMVYNIIAVSPNYPAYSMS